ncbi:MAG TPA: STT3 domain-containing protein, partial [Candidatus Binatia bacterium]
DRHQAEYRAAGAAVRAELKSELGFEGKDGRRYTHLGDFDSYAWLRQARNYLDHGTFCDAVVEGECRDTYGHAPVGYKMIYSRPLHVGAIAAVARAATLFRPDYPLAASAFLVPVLIGTLGVLPAFFLGRRLAGNPGGVFAALFISLQPQFLLRSIGGDNDVWNVVLPLFAAWALIAALDARARTPATLFAVLAGFFTGLHAAAWSGWSFTFVVLIGAVLARLILFSVSLALGERASGFWGFRGFRGFWRREEIQIGALVLAVYYLSAGVFALLAGDEAPFLSISVGRIKGILRMLGLLRSLPAAAPGADYWPQGLKTVAEFARPYSLDIVRHMGGVFFSSAAGWGCSWCFSRTGGGRGTLSWSSA